MARNIKAAAANTNAIGAYVNALFDAMVANAKADDLAYEMVKDCTTVDGTNKVRDDFKAAYIARRKSDDGAAFDADKAKAAGDMAWSRVCAKAKDRGWVKPVAENAKAKAARDSRAKASAGKVDGRTTKTGSRASNKTVKGIIVDDDEVQVAVDWVMEDETRITLFLKWVESQQSNTRTVRRAA